MKIKHLEDSLPPTTLWFQVYLIQLPAGGGGGALIWDWILGGLSAGAPPKDRSH